MSRTKATVQLVALALGVVASPISASGAAAAGSPLPAWPQKFYVNALEPHGFGLPVTTAGTITVSVHAQGAPIVVTLIRPDGGPAQQSTGTGDLSMSYLASPAEVAASPLWRISLALQQPAPGAEASGSVQVQEPPIDTRKLAAFLAQPRPPGVPPDAAARAALAKQHQAKIDATKHEFEQARVARQAARFEAIRPRLEAAQARAAQPVTTRGLVSPSVLTAPNVMRPPVMQPIPIARPAPSPPPPPPPVVALPLYTDQGEPGDTIPIAGSGFGASGTVHFVLGTKPTDNYSAPITTWSENQIFATVPAVTGYVALTGTLYVVRAADGAISQYLPFHFLPTMDLEAYPVPPQNSQDSVIANYDNGWCMYLLQNTYQLAPVASWPVNGWAVDPSFQNPSLRTAFPCDGAGGVLNGYAGDDVFFQTAQLKNGWVLDHVDLIWAPGVPKCSAGYGAYISQANPPAINSSSPLVDVRVWADACFSGDNHPVYMLDVWVRGPLGIPFQ